jgi:hypothetical protein
MKKKIINKNLFKKILLNGKKILFNNINKKENLQIFHKICFNYDYFIFIQLDKLLKVSFIFKIHWEILQFFTRNFISSHW